jgi:SpoVK/Ycf46/Vps4 family AAA+-type ATPase
MSKKAGGGTRRSDGSDRFELLVGEDGGLVVVEYRHGDSPSFNPIKMPGAAQAAIPLQRLTTRHGWDDLVLDAAARDEIETLLAWVRHQDRLLGEWDLGRRLGPGYRALFHGPAGTGKALTAALLGQQLDATVYRVDLSAIISKYIGETEKNLSAVVELAPAILFVDATPFLGADHAPQRSPDDRAANRQVSYLLRRLEDYAGVAVVAADVDALADVSWCRHFQSVVHFPIPDAELRGRLWRDAFAGKPYPLADDVDLAALARDHELTGGAIAEVLRFACLQAVRREVSEIRAADVQRGVERELRKLGTSAS